MGFYAFHLKTGQWIVCYIWESRECGQAGKEAQVEIEPRLPKLTARPPALHYLNDFNIDSTEK